ncbi:metal-binding protein [Muricauda sp. CAU 1633]|uniref:Ada metal-binding domain-containing protein n=1 Tax=Allomuricauda sp. CAU 1633 TaxID=2816036 RepID=UPI001A9078EC|nr:Ada metal-binding domain-containing protein [Muricauda sp. CAU 1633]MBO0322303.1 metal-binding protein [Muricauda sp. CAU 1633]
MEQHSLLTDSTVRQGIKNGKILFGGNKNLKIYGTLKCTSGKRMKRKNRVFFTSEEEALSMEYRPCGHCMKTAYKKWKNGFIQ